MSLRDRILNFIEAKGLTVQSFEKMVGLSNGAVSKMGDNTRRGTLDKISSRFPELNCSWLLTGEGEMLNEGAMDALGNAKDPDPVIVENAGKPKGRMIPFYDAETTGGFEGRVAASDGVASLKGYINAGDWFDGRETAAIRHTGESMTEYPDGCILAVKEVRNINLLVPGRNYVIETDEYRVTKRVQKGSEPGKIALYSSNQEKYDDGRLVFEPFELDVQDIRRVFTVLGYIVNQYGESHLIRI